MRTILVFPPAFRVGLLDFYVRSDPPPPSPPPPVLQTPDIPSSSGAIDTNSRYIRQLRLQTPSVSRPILANSSSRLPQYLGVGMVRSKVIFVYFSWGPRPLWDVRNADNSRNPPAPRPNLRPGRYACPQGAGAGAQRARCPQGGTVIHLWL